MATLFFKVQADYQEVIRLQQEIRNLQNQLRNARFDTPVEVLCNKLAKANMRLNDLVRNASLAGQNLQTMASRMSATSTTMSSVGNGMGNAFNKANDATRNMSHSLRDTRRTMDELKNSTNGATINLGNFIKNVSIAKMTLSALNRVVGLIKGSMNTMISFEQANATLQAITGVAGDEFDKLKERSLELGRTTAYTASQVTELETELAKLGFSTDDILGMSGAVLNFAQSTGSSLADAASTAGAAIRIFEKQGKTFEETAENTTKLVSAMSAATRMSALDFSAISNNLATFAPMAHTMGMEIEDVLALFGKLKDQGIEASTAMTSLRNIFTKVSQGKIEGIGKVSGLDDFIAGLENATKAFGNDVGKAMKAIGPRGGTQFMSLLTAFNKKERDEITGEEVDSITNLRNRIRREMENSSGLDTMAETMNDNVAGAIKKLSSAWEGFVLSFSQSTGPMAGAIGVVTDGVNKLTNAITGGTGELSEETFQSLTIAIETLVGTLVAYEAIQGSIAAKQALVNTYTEIEVAQYTQLATAMNMANIERGETIAEMATQLVAEGNLDKARAKEIVTTLQEAVLSGRMTEARAKEILASQGVVGALARETEERMLNAKAKMAQLQEEEETIMSLLEEAEAIDEVTGGLTDEQKASAKLWLQEELLATAEKKEAVQTEIDAIAHRQSAIAKTADGVATGFLSKALDVLGLSMLKNPYVLVAMGIAALGVALYNFYNRTTIAEQATENLNEAMEEQAKKYDDLIHKSSDYISTMSDETKTVLERYQAYKDLLDLYEEFQGYSMDDIINMSSEERNAIINQANERRKEKDNETRVKVYEELSGLKDFSISKDQLNEVLDKYGIKDDKEREAYQKELESITRWEGDSNYYTTALNQFKGMLDSIATDKSLAVVVDNMNKIGNSVAKNTETSTEYIDRLKDKLHEIPETAEELSKNNYLLANPKKEIEPMIDELNDKVRKLNEDLAKTTDKDKKIEIEAQLADTQRTKEVYEMLKNAMDKNDYEAIVRIKAELEDDSVMSSDVAETISNSFNKVQTDVNNYIGCLKEARENNEKLSDVMERRGVKREEIEKNVGLAYDESKKKVEELTKKLNDEKLTKKQKAQIEVDLREVGAELKDLEEIKRIIKDMDGSQASVDFLINYTIDTSEQEAQIRDIIDRYKRIGLTDLAKFYEENLLNPLIERGKASKRHQEANVTKPKQTETPEPETTDTSDADDKKKKEKQRQESIKQADMAFKEAMKKQEETYQKQMEDIAKRGEDARLKAMANGRLKTIEETKNRQANELKAEEDYWKNLQKTREDQVKAMWEKQEALNKAKGGENYSKKYWEDLSDDQKNDFVQKNNLNMGLTPEEALKSAQEVMDVRKRHARENEKIRKDDIKALNDYVKEYGDDEEKRLAIVKDYEMQIQEALEGGDYTKARSLGMKMNESLEEFDFNKFKENLNWDEVFNDLDRRSIESLENLREELRRALDIKNLTWEDAKVITEQIDKVTDMIRSKGNIFQSLFGGAQGISEILENRQRKTEAIEARQNATKSSNEALNASVAYNASKGILEKLLRDNGIQKSINEVTQEDIDNARDKNAIIAQMGIVDRDKAIMLATRRKADKDEAEAKSKEEKAKKTTDDRLAMTTAIMGMINQNIQSMNHLNESLGLNDTGFGEKVAQVAEVTGSATQAMQSFMQGDFIGAAASAVDAIMGIGKIFGATYGNMDAMNEEIERLNDTNRTLINALGDVKEALQNSTVFEATDEYNKAIELYTMAQKNQSQILRDEAGKWEKGSHSISGQLNRDREFRDLMNQVSTTLNKRVDNSSQFLSLTADEMKKLREEDSELFIKILAKYREAENSHTGTGVDEMIEDYISQYAGQLEELEGELNSKFTGMSFDQMFDSFKSTLQNMSSTAEDFAKSTEDMFNNIALNMIAEEYKDELQKVYKAMNADMSKQSGRLTQTQQADYEKQLKALADKALEQREYLEEIGMVSNTDTQESSSRGVGQMTQETANEMNGRMTMIQIAVEQLRNLAIGREDSITSIHGNMDGLANISNTISDDVSSIVEQLANSHLELMAINENTRRTWQAIGELQDIMEGVRRNTSGI